MQGKDRRSKDAEMLEKMAVGQGFEPREGY